MRTIAVTALLLLWLAVRSQAYIPDTNMRDWLNEQAAGIIDAGGIMDTLHPSIPQMDSLTFPFFGTLSELDLEGIQYLDSLRRFDVSILSEIPTTVHCDALPPFLTRLEIFVNGGVIDLPAIPNSLAQLTLGNNPGTEPTEVILAGLPDPLGILELYAISTVVWGNTGQVGWFRVVDNTFEQSTSLEFPAMTVGSVNFYGGQWTDLDLALLNTEQIIFTDSHFQTPINWPGTLRDLYMTNVAVFQGIGPLPETLELLDVHSNTDFCIPTLPDGLEHLTLEVPTFTCLPNWPSGLDTCYAGFETYTEGTVPYCSLLNSSCPGSYPVLAGRVFIDSDADEQYDPGESGLQQASVTVQPNGNIVGCDADGAWVIAVAPGAYTITVTNNYPYLQSVTPAMHSADVQEIGSIDVGNHFAVQLTPNIADLRAWLLADPARPGFDNRLYLTCQNYGSIPLDAELSLTYDADQSWVGSSVAPTSTTGNGATWAFQGMPVGSTTTITVDLNTAASVALGTAIDHTLFTSAAQPDETPNDNLYLFTDSVVGSFDPNDKLLRPAVLTPLEVQAGETPIEYTIRFQNTGTYMAERVVILDTLSGDLQWSSLRFLDSSHPNHWYVTDGVLHVVHDAINLPDSNSNEAGSHGFVRFTILPATDLDDGESITNIAHIVFDFNEPIVTPPAVFSVDASTSIAAQQRTTFGIHPNPVRDRLYITGADALKGTITYRICDPLGKVVLNGTWTNGGIDVQALAPGMYTLLDDQADQRGGIRFVKE